MISRIRSLGALVAITAAILAAPNAAFATASSTFTSDVEYWQLFQSALSTCSTSDNPPAYSSTGGNPGGYVSGQDVLEEPVQYMRFVSPCALASPWVDSHAENTGGTFSFDLRANGTPDRGPFVQIIALDNSYLFTPDFLAAPTANTWTNYSLTLSAESGDFDYCDAESNCNEDATNNEIISVLTNFYRLHLVADTDTGIGEVVDLDNPSFSGGSMPADTDGDEVPDVIDECPTRVGLDRSDGCPLERSLSLRYVNSTHRFKGKLTIESGPDQCVVGRTVQVFKKVDGPDRNIGQATTTAVATPDIGKYKLFKRNVSGRYYSKVAYEVVEGVGCAAAKSPTITRS